MFPHETQCFYRKKAAPLSSLDSKAAGIAHNMKLISALGRQFVQCVAGDDHLSISTKVPARVWGKGTSLHLIRTN
ncbi:hypothetical protein D1872_287010 [compost metagenome]